MALVSAVWRDVQARLEALHEVGPREGKDLVEAIFPVGGDGRHAWEATEFPAELTDQLERLTGERGRGVPLAQVLGYAWFYGRRWTVTPHVLIPRPDTEILIEEVLKRLEPGYRLAEVGVGTGCVMGTILAERTDGTAYGAELSEAAADVARGNLTGLDIDGRWQVEVRDGLDGVDSMFTHLVSNPPYVTDTEWESLETEVKDFEPRMALTGAVPNPDGLVFYRRLAEWGRNKVQPRGWLCMETGWQQAQAVKKLLQEQMTAEGSVWQDISVTKDLAGRERVVCARRC